MSYPIQPLFNFNPPPQAHDAFRDTFNDWRVTPLQPWDFGGDVHATWERGADTFHITTQLPGFPGGLRHQDWFDINK